MFALGVVVCSVCDLLLYKEATLLFLPGKKNLCEFTIAYHRRIHHGGVEERQD